MVKKPDTFSVIIHMFQWWSLAFVTESCAEYLYVFCTSNQRRNLNNCHGWSKIMILAILLPIAKAVCLWVRVSNRENSETVKDWYKGRLLSSCWFNFPKLRLCGRAVVKAQRIRRFRNYFLASFLRRSPGWRVARDLIQRPRVTRGCSPDPAIWLISTRCSRPE